MMQKMIMKRAGILFFLLFLVFLISGLSGSFITFDRLNWYKTLPLSSLTPPDVWFSIVWSVLYFLMAISAFLVWDKASPRYFVLQLVTNGVWPFLFFYMHSPIAGLIDILLMIIFSKCVLNGNLDYLIDNDPNFIHDTRNDIINIFTHSINDYTFYIYTTP